MKHQTYKNHIKWYAPHHFIFYPVLIVAFFISIYLSLKGDTGTLVWAAIAFLFLLLLLLSLMMRQHYALGNQNRIVRLELRLRYYILTQQRLEHLEDKLSFSQLAALRFASDKEFIELINKAIKEDLSGDEIKRSIKNWLPDEMRL